MGEPVTAAHVGLARDAHLRFGWGMGRGEPRLRRQLLPRAGQGQRRAVALQGGDFARTDIAPCP